MTIQENMDLRYTSLAFFFFGFLEFFCYNIIISGSQDILAGTNVPTSLVLFIGIVPICAVVGIAPYFVQEISYGVRIAFGVVIGVAGFVLVAYVGNVKWKLTGVGLVTLSMGAIEISFLGLMSYFESTVVSSYSAGTGVGFFIAPLYYIAMTTWLCVSPKITIVLVALLLPLYLLSYYIVDKSMQDGSSQDGGGVAYTKLESSDTEDFQERSKEKRNELKAMNTVSAKEGLSWKEKFRVLRKMLYIVALQEFIGYHSEYLIIQSVISTIAYKNAPFRPRDHYQYYIIIFMFGELIGRCHRSLLSFIKPSWLYQPTPASLWVFAVLEMLHLFFFIFESWYRFLPNIASTLVLCITAGIFIGLLFSNAVEVLHASFRGKHRELAISFFLSPSYVAITMSAIVGLYVEPRLFEHCTSIISNSAYCVTRSKSLVDITAKCGIK